MALTSPCRALRKVFGVFNTDFQQVCCNLLGFRDIILDKSNQGVPSGMHGTLHCSILARDTAGDIAEGSHKWGSFVSYSRTFLRVLNQATSTRSVSRSRIELKLSALICCAPVCLAAVMLGIRCRVALNTRALGKEVRVKNATESFLTSSVNTRTNAQSKKGQALYHGYGGALCENE